MSNEWKSLKILIVDDDSFQRTIVTKVLNLLGVTQVASAAEATRPNYDLQRDGTCSFLI